jgi:capsid protein
MSKAHTPASPLTRESHRKPPSQTAKVVHGDSDTLVRRGRFTCLGYRSAGQLGRDGTYAMPGSEDWHMANDRVHLVNQSLQFYRDNGLYRGLVDRAVINAVGSGFGHQARSASKAWNGECERLWRDEFEDEPEVRNLFSWAECLAMALAELLKTGDHAALLLSKPAEVDGKVQLIDSDRIAGGPKGLLRGNGVETDSMGRPVRFWISPYSELGQVDTARARAYPAEDVAWMALLDRPSQTRGMPAAQSAFPMLHRISDVCDSEALAWQILARVAISISREDGGALADMGIADPSKAGEDRSATGEVALTVHEFDSALVFHATNAGDHIAGVERNIPGQNFPDAIRMFLRLMGLPLGLPLELVLMDFSQTNYSSIRGSLEQAFATFRRLQRLVERYSRTIRNRWVDRMVVAGKLGAREDAHRHEWVKPDFPWLDELKEAQAWGAKVDRGFATHSQACKSLNQDRDELMDTREAEVVDAIERASRIEATHPGRKVPWEMFAGLRAAEAKTPPSAQPGHAPDVGDRQDDAREPGERQEPDAEVDGERPQEAPDEAQTEEGE